MARKKGKVPNDFCDPTASDIRASNPSSTPASDAPTTSTSNPSPSKSASQFSSTPKPASKPPLTHFLCIPLINPSSLRQLQSSLERFKEAVCATEGIPEKAIRPVGTLHLTLGVMSLDGAGLERAGNMLRGLDLRTLLSESSSPDARPPGSTPSPPQPEARSSRDAGTAKTAALETALAGTALSTTSTCSTTQTGAAPVSASSFNPLTVSLQGLYPMPPQPPHSTSLLYASPHDASGRLYPFASRLRMLFMDAGLLVADERPLRLHATVVNTVYAKEKGRGRGGKGAVKVDARGMVERWGEVVWAKDVMIERVGICRMGARRVEGVGEEYEEVVGMEI